jgi:16S rRNA (uracil1498-N3)-methyltransferase
MSERFFVEGLLEPGPFTLRGPEAHHLGGVLRARPGDRVVLFNGDGSDYPAEVVSADRKTVTLEVAAGIPTGRELTFRLEVACALPKGDRADFLVEKLTELGATDLVPLRTRRSVVEAKEGKIEKLQRAVVEACKQCRRSVLMRVHPAADWAEYCRRPGLPAARWLAHVPPDGTLSPLAPPGPDGVALAIGPEGGFADEEVTAAEGWQVVGLGPRVLRVETAAVALVCRAIYG